MFNCRLKSIFFDRLKLDRKWKVLKHKGNFLLHPRFFIFDSPPSKHLLFAPFYNKVIRHVFLYGIENEVHFYISTISINRNPNRAATLYVQKRQDNYFFQRVDRGH